MTRMRWIVVLIVIVLLVLLIAAIMPLRSGLAGWRDFLPYWSASHLMVTGGDPYNLDALNQLNAQVAPERGLVEPAWNPPWLVLILAPLGLLSYEYAARVWLAIVGLAFGASLVQIAIGQITVIILLGVVLCLAALRSGHDGWAGAVLVLSLSKPHLIYLALPLILIWAAVHRRWRVWLGLIVAALMGLGVATLLSPNWPSGYLHALGGNDFFMKLSATIGGFTKEILGIDTLRYLSIATLILLPWLTRLSDRRGLLTGVNVALLISVPLAPYGWSFDQIMLLPAITQMVFWISRTVDARSRRVYAGCLIAIYALMLAMKLTGLGDFVFVWVPLALGLLYAMLYRAQPLKPARDDVPNIG